MNKLFKALFVVGLSLALVSPALADSSIYGSMRYDTFYINQKSDGTMNTAGKTSYTALYQALQGNSRFGAKWKDGNLSGRFEVGTGINLRLLYGEYKFDGGNLLIGQAYTPNDYLTNQVIFADNGNIGFGCLWDSRQPMIKVSLDNGFFVALIDPKSGAIEGGTTAVFVPKTVVGYEGKIQSFSIGGGVAYNGFSEKNQATNFDKTINSYLVYVHGHANLNPVKVLFQVHYGQNLHNYGISGRDGASAMVVNGALKNANGYGLELQAGAQVTQNASVYVGMGYTHDKVQDAAKAAKQLSVFVNAPIKLAKGFQIVPEFDYFHYGDVASSVPLPAESGFAGHVKNAYAFGAKWQMDF